MNKFQKYINEKLNYDIYYSEVFGWYYYEEISYTMKPSIQIFLGDTPAKVLEELQKITMTKLLLGETYVPPKDTKQNQD